MGEPRTRRRGTPRGPSNLQRYLVIATAVVLVAVLGLGGLVVYRLIVPVDREPRTAFEMELLRVETEIAENPQDASLRIELSDLYFQQGRLEEAQEILQEGYDLDPIPPTLAMLDVASARIAEEDGRPDDAKELYRGSIAQLPTFDAQYRLGNLEAEEGNHDEAIEHWLDALELRPGNAWLRRDVAARLESIGRYEDALEQMRLLEEFIPDDPDLQAEIERLEREVDGDD